ncbi:DinB family protein [Paenibacillus sp. RC67]|uniref:DinB family protein n=1 Tax=Paenibacillus sp. RC67 TaxID=3039392 RepID=UPI0024AD002B|nr:DinB family protein [Paenibacillus sp. RC67]
MFTSIQQFAASWSNETAATQRVMDVLTDASLNQKITADHRSLGQLAWHLTTTIHEMTSRTGLEFTPAAEDEHAPAPASAKAIADAYRSQRNALLEAVQAQWKDEDLVRTTSMYGEEWPNGLTLHLLIQHEIHHRGQMTVLMRQAGLRVPDIYGPTREDWIERGMAPLA